MSTTTVKKPRRNTYKNVKRVLETSLVARDLDRMLIRHVWMLELREQGIDPEKLTAYDFLKGYADDSLKLSHAERIRRVRQQLQESTPELRGSRYVDRQTHSRLVRHFVGHGNNFKDVSENLV